MQQLVGDLERAGVIVRERVGRRNRYVVCGERGFPHTVVAGVTLGAFLDLVAEDRAPSVCPAAVPASTSSCLIATGFGCPLEATEQTELARRSEKALSRQPAR